VLSSDLRDFIASGMSTLKAKFDTVEEAKVVMRAAEVWSFFWGQVLPVSAIPLLPTSLFPSWPHLDAIVLLRPQSFERGFVTIMTVS
jgi:hypothetical protein